MKWTTAKTITAIAALGLVAQTPAFSADTDQNKRSKQSSSSSEKKLRGSKAKGSPVTSKSGENLGTVEDIIIDPDSGQVLFVIIAPAGGGGGSQTYNPVPWQAIDVQPNGSFTANTDKQKLQSAPTVTSSHFADQTPAEVVAIYEFYAVPVPASGSSGSGSSSTQPGQDQSDKSQDKGNQQQGQDSLQNQNGQQKTTK